MGTEAKIYVGYRVTFKQDYKAFKVGQAVYINKTDAKRVHAGRDISLAFFNGYDSSWEHNIPANIMQLERVNRTVTTTETITFHPVTF